MFYRRKQKQKTTNKAMPSQWLKSWFLSKTPSMDWTHAYSFLPADPPHSIRKRSGGPADREGRSLRGWSALATPTLGPGPAKVSRPSGLTERGHLSLRRCHCGVCFTRRPEASTMTQKALPVERGQLPQVSSGWAENRRVLPPCVPWELSRELRWERTPGLSVGTKESCQP